MPAWVRGRSALIFAAAIAGTTMFGVGLGVGCLLMAHRAETRVEEFGGSPASENPVTVPTRAETAEVAYRFLLSQPEVKRCQVLYLDMEGKDPPRSVLLALKDYPVKPVSQFQESPVSLKLSVGMAQREDIDTWLVPCGWTRTPFVFGAYELKVRKIDGKCSVRGYGRGVY